MSESVRIGPGARVRLVYRLFDASGDLVEEVDAKEPVTFVHGGEDLLPGLERALQGLAAGEEVEVTLPPEEAYGAYDPAGLICVPRVELPPEPAPEKGDWISVEIERDDQTTDEMEMRVVETSGEEVVLDANHPLAGQQVTFHARVLTVESTAR